jgi:hypothetical protein
MVKGPWRRRNTEYLQQTVTLDPVRKSNLPGIIFKIPAPGLAGSTH